MKTFLGIELGSTRIKAVLIDEGYNAVATGGFDWENRFENGFWTYHMDDVWIGLRQSFAQLIDDFTANYKSFPEIACIGVSSMMHGYLVFDKDDNQLVPFRTWRNTNTEQAAKLLTEAFDFNIPHRWSSAHIYQAMLNGEDHVKDADFLTTLAGYIHYKLTGKKVLGVGDASGMFPIDSEICDYNPKLLEKFDLLAAEYGVSRKLYDLMPKVLSAGADAGSLTEEGAKLLDPAGALKAGIPLCAPEGDAGTGMVATNSVAPRTGNVSAGTSIFAMLVLERELSRVYPEIDMVTTPTGAPVAMVHCNNCTSDFDAWVKVFGEAAAQMGADYTKSELYNTMYKAALTGDKDCGGIISCNYLSGEPITGFHAGRPLVVRTPDSSFTFGNFMRSLLFSAMATLKIGMDILTDNERVIVNQLLGHGGLFKTKVVGQTLMAGALNVPVAVMESAGEGGAWGIALLAAYTVQKSGAESLEDFLAKKVFANSAVIRTEPDKADIQGFEAYMKRYHAMLSVEQAAVDHLKDMAEE